jgi:hypothetical protein
MSGWRVIVAGGLLSGLAASAGAGPAVDVLLAQVEVRTIAASDIALARALGVLGFAPTAGPIERRDVERFVDALLILEEAARIGITVDQADVERAWTAMVTRVGSETTLERWLATHGIEEAWARRFVADDVVRGRFFEARFVAFVFVGDEEVARALGPGEHDEATRERTRAQIARAAAEKAQAEWLVAARRRANIRFLLSDSRSVELPFPPP